KVESEELKFYLRDYSFDSDANRPEANYLFRKDDAGRLRAGLFQKGDIRLFVDPVFGAAHFRSGGKSNTQYYSGVRLGAYFGKRWGVNFSFRDVTEKGDSIDRTRAFTPQEGIVTTIGLDRSINFSNLNFNIGYRWSNGSVSAGKENLSWGYGLGGNIVLSGKAPSFPFIRFDYKPWSWLHFNYFHGWLQSNVIDSNETYNTGSGIYGGIREQYIPKFIASHTITITPLKGLVVALGESMVYSDKLNIGYLIPINFFKIYDQQESRYNIRVGDNSQFFGMVSSRNQLKNTHIYAQVFIDEIRASKIFNSRERRNQLGYTLGINRTDLFLNYLTAGIEYSRINPFVYRNLLPAQTYESHSYSLGDWMGNNSDRLYAFLQYNPLPKMQLKLWHQDVRKGAAGTLEQQYFQQPQPGFLFQKLFDYKETGASIRYEWINRLIFFAEANRTSIQYTGGAESTGKRVRLGFSYGL
ncbi:MAG TPA: hypothetical protein VFR58_17025, partial [Flavisolibacter sp.]|nr:hypothetical protein [Flavisolibacter sp.]